MQLTFNLQQPIEVVFDYLTDMQKFVSVHPVITKMDWLSANKYLVHETLRFGFIPVSFTYPVTIDQNDKDKTIVIRATVMKITKIEMNYKLDRFNGLTTIDETITIKSLLPIQSVMERIFRKQHGLLFQNIGAVKSE